MGAGDHDEYVRNLELLVTARTEQLREAVRKIEELTAELERPSGSFQKLWSGRLTVATPTIGARRVWSAVRPAVSSAVPNLVPAKLPCTIRALHN